MSADKADATAGVGGRGGGPTPKSLSRTQQLQSPAQSLQVQTERNEHHDVFISYRRGICGNRKIDDLVSAIHLELILKAKGITVFVDKSGISVGDSWRDKFMTELKFAQVVILVITRNTLIRYEHPKPPGLASMLSSMLASGVQALTEPIVSLSRGGSHSSGGSQSDTSPRRASSTDSVDNVLLEWMIAMSLQKQKIIIPVFIGDSDPVTGNVGNLMDQGILNDLLEPPDHVLDATRAYASAFLASQCEPPVLLAECCASLSSLIGKCGIGSLNGVVVKSVAWDIVAEIIASHVLQSPLLRELLAGLTPKKTTPGCSSDDASSSTGTPIARDLSQAFNLAERSEDSAESLYELCFLRTQLWPHAALQGKPFRRRNSAGFSLFIAEPAELRGISVDLFPPFPFQTFYVFFTRAQNPNCSEFVQTWKNDCCTLQLPCIHQSIATISCHHATLRFCGEPFECNGIGLADGHFDISNPMNLNLTPPAAAPPPPPTAIRTFSSPIMLEYLLDPESCPCGLPNPHRKTSSYQGTFVLSFPHVGKDKVLLRKRVPTAADAFRLDNSEGGFASLDANGASFRYFMLSNVVIGISDPVAPPPPRDATLCAEHGQSVLGPTSPLNNRSLLKLCSEPHLFNNKLRSSLRGGTVSDMEQGDWQKMLSCWSD